MRLCPLPPQKNVYMLGIMIHSSGLNLRTKETLIELSGVKVCIHFGGIFLCVTDIVKVTQLAPMDNITDDSMLLSLYTLQLHSQFIEGITYFITHAKNLSG